MLYEIIGISRASTMNEVRDIVRVVGNQILSRGGVIRDVEWMGRAYLPKLISKNQQNHAIGHHFSIVFDGGPGLQMDVHKTLKVDPRMVRATIFKVGGK
ncbi:mitochondrial 37S ribosomal protein bS6m [Dipodascopsis tothii]|uniref:mitochondrial 37S ribosomal protein bS6m n=1 Tax=Dipodascopsis tothii TaxID=44089 RepID=UPI0034CD98AB